MGSPRLKEKYSTEMVPALKEKFQYKCTRTPQLLLIEYLIELCRFLESKIENLYCLDMLAGWSGEKMQKETKQVWSQG